MVEPALPASVPLEYGNYRLTFLYCKQLAKPDMEDRSFTSRCRPRGVSPAFLIALAALAWIPAGITWTRYFSQRSQEQKALIQIDRIDAAIRRLEDAQRILESSSQGFRRSKALQLHTAGEVTAGADALPSAH